MGDACGPTGAPTACSSRAKGDGDGFDAGPNGACEPMPRSSGSGATPRQTRLNSADHSAHSDNVEQNIEV